MWDNFKIWPVFGARRADLRNYFDTIDLETVLPRFLSYLHEASKAENVVWLLKEEFEHLKNCADTGAPFEPTQNLNRNVVLQATRNIEEVSILNIIKCFAAQGGNSELQEIEGKFYGLLPIFMPSKGQVGAYVLVCGIPGKKPARTLVELTGDVGVMSKHIDFSIQHWEAKRSAFIDDLSGLYTQAYMGLVVLNEIQRAQRAKKKFSVLFMDIDFFKSINDVNGHWIGSRILVELGHIFKNNVRKSDYGFRYGGDEFVVVLPETNAEQAVIVAERLRSKVEQTDFIIDGVRLRVTMSVGLATYPDHAQTCKDIIQMADEAMYSGKHKGRNIVFVAS